MKRNLLLITAFFLIFSGCGTEEYPSFKYTNETDTPIEFKTAEKDSPVYKLDKDEGNPGDKYSMSLSSGVYGRGEITRINERLVSWEYNSKNVYDIRFVKKGYILEIENHTDNEIILTEQFRLIEPEFVTIKEFDTILDEPGEPELPPGVTDVSLYTENPVLKFVNNTDVSFRLRRSGNKFTLVIR